MTSDRPKPPPGVLFHFDASDPATYELDERGRVRAILGPDGKPVMVQDDPEKRPRLVNGGMVFGDEGESDG